MQSVNFKLLKPEEVHTFTFRILTIASSLIHQDEFLASIYPLLQRENDNLSMALGQVRGSKFTSLLAERDSLRDRLFMGFRYYITAFTFHPDEKIANAAQFLENLVEKRGVTLYNLGYTEETSQLNGLLNDLKSPDAQAALVLIQDNYWVTTLTNAQQEFEALYQEKVETEAIQDLPKLTTSKNNVAHYLSRLLQYIDTNRELNPEKYQSVADKIDEVITDVMTIARARKTKQNEKTNPPQA